jgi:type I restriction enzyme, S subunit
MGSEWQTLPFGELYSIPSRNGLTKPKRLRGQGYKFINMGEIFKFDRMLDIPCDRAPATENELISSTLEIGDLLFARQSLVLSGAGKCSIFLGDSEPVIFESHLIRVRPDTEIIDSEYLFYYFNSPMGRSEILGITEQGAGQSGIRGSDLRTIKVSFPTLQQQKSIVSVLSVIDDKIHLNHQINQSLESIAQTLFKSWFVDFDPVKAKRERHQPEGMDVETGALFPDKIVDSELGMIPEGWDVLKLGSVLDILETGKRPKGGVSKYKDGIPSIGAENILGIGKYNYSKEKYIPTEFYTSMKRGIIASEDVLLYKDGGKPGVFKPRVSMFGHDFPYEEATINEHVFRIRSDSLGQYFMYFLLGSERIIHELAQRGGKAAIPGINQQEVRSIKFIRPPNDIVKRFNEAASPIGQMILQNSNHNKTLSDTRDALIPKLISGDIHIHIEDSP